MSVSYSPEKSFSYIKGVASGLGWKDTIAALYFARDKHAEQKRKSGEPYITHPLTMANHAIALGFNNDAIVATALLHDVVEDCGVDIRDIPCSDEVKTAVKLLSYEKPKDGDKQAALRKYYDAIGDNFTAVMVKLIDRCHNVSTMAGTFTVAKLEEYITETRTYVLPLWRLAKDKYPEYSNQLFLLKYHIQSVIDAIAETLKVGH